MLERIVELLERIVELLEAGDGGEAKPAAKKKVAKKKAAAKKSDGATIAGVRAALKKLMQKHDKAAVTDLLGEFEAGSVSDLDEAQYAEVIEEATSRLDDEEAGDDDVLD